MVLNVYEACQFLSIGRTKLYQLIKDGKIPAKKLDGKTIFLKQDLEDFVTQLPSL